MVAHLRGTPTLSMDIRPRRTATAGADDGDNCSALKSRSARLRAAGGTTATDDRDEKLVRDLERARVALFGKSLADHLTIVGLRLDAVAVDQPVVEVEQPADRHDVIERVFVPARREDRIHVLLLYA